jgi:hypothetical protein
LAEPGSHEDVLLEPLQVRVGSPELRDGAEVDVLGFDRLPVAQPLFGLWSRDPHPPVFDVHTRAVRGLEGVFRSQLRGSAFAVELIVRACFEHGSLAATGDCPTENRDAASLAVSRLADLYG